MQADKITDRYKYPVSDAELDRRLAAAQQAMKAEGLDCLVTQNHSPIFDGGIRYFLDRPTDQYSSSLLIPAEGQMVFVNHGPEIGQAIPNPMRNVEKMIIKPYCLTFTFSDTMAAEVIADEIKARGYKRVGLYGTQFISYSFGEYLKENLPDVTFVNFNKQMAVVTGVKSEEEKELAVLSVRYHERLMAAVPGLIVPGKLECEVRAEICAMALQMGCETIGNVAVGTGPVDTVNMFQKHFWGNRRIRKGDNVVVMIEVAAPGGFYSELTRPFVLGKASDNLKRMFEISRGCQAAVAAAAKPGVTGAELTQVYNDYVDSFNLGIEHNTRNCGHSQGYDMMEGPALGPLEDVPFRENMFISIHPELTALNNFVNCCDNFFITPNGAEKITNFEQKVFELDV